MMRLFVWPRRNPSSVFSLRQYTVISSRQLFASSQTAEPNANSFQLPDAKPFSGAATGDGDVRSNPLSRIRRGGVNRTISTLDPKRLDSGCFLALSKIAQPMVHIMLPDQRLSVSFGYHYEIVDRGTGTRRKKWTPFPPGTHGFLYFYSHPQNPSQPQIRFRVTQDNNHASFSRGHDLTYRKGYPWHLSVTAVAPKSPKNALLRLLIHDGLVSPTTISEPPDPNRPGKGNIRRVISSLRDPFVMDLTKLRPRILVYAAGRGHGLRLPFTYVVAFTQRHKIISLFNGGSVLCRFERSTLPEHEGRDVVVLRLLKVLNPPKPNPNVPAVNTALPGEGELFTRRYHVWYKDLAEDSKLARVLRVLYDVDKDQQPS